MTFLNRLALQLIHAVRARPWLRMTLGVALTATGVAELLIGAGHGGLAAVGALLTARSAVDLWKRTARQADDRGPRVADPRSRAGGRGI